MFRSIRTSILAVVALLLAASALHAEPVTYNIDRAHSEVAFKIRHFFSKTPGHFDDFAGILRFDEKNLAASTVDVTIQSASINTGNERRDNHLRSKDFFAADSFPTLTFKSTKVIPGEGKSFTIEGDLTMRGITRPVTLDAELVGMGAIGINGNVMGTRAGFQASTKVNRKDWDILWNRVLDNGGTMLDDMVEIELGVEAIKEDPKQG
jgi:polyisoprenoid-binding protein YceI